MLKSLGAKSLAGFRAKPQLKPKQIPIASTVSPMYRGTSCLVTCSVWTMTMKMVAVLAMMLVTMTCMFLLSVMAQTQRTNRPVARNWSPIPPRGGVTLVDW